MQEKNISVIRNPNLHIIFLVTLFAVMGVSSIAPALPLIMRELHVKPGEIGLLITAFTLPGMILTPVMGILADRYGRKIILIPSLFLFGIGGFLCSFARSFEILLLLRFIQGIGAASLGSINVTLIGDIFSGNQRATAIGYNSGVLNIGTASYPAIGGSLALAGWHYPFLLPLLAIPVGLIVLFRLKNPEPEAPHSMRQYLINTWKNINKPKVWGLFVINMLVFFILYGTIQTYFPVHLENKFGVNTLIIGLVISSMSVTTAIAASLTGYLARRYTVRKLLLTAYSIYMVSMCIIPFVNRIILIIPVILVAGFCHGIAMPNVQNLMVGMAPLTERAAFMSLNSMVLRTGQTLGPLFMGFLYSIADTEATFFGAAGITIIMFIITLIFIKQ
jgi:MFS transporter, ACDE family, multidrug resistance protein